MMKLKCNTRNKDKNYPWSSLKTMDNAMMRGGKGDY